MGAEWSYATLAPYFERARAALRVACRLRSPDPNDLPVVKRGFLAQAADTAVIVEALELARALANAEPLSGLLARELPPAGRELRDHVAATLAIADRIAATLI